MCVCAIYVWRNFEEYPYVWMVVLEDDMSSSMINAESRRVSGTIASMMTYTC